jgi:hypothetical protein
VRKMKKVSKMATVIAIIMLMIIPIAQAYNPWNWIWRVADRDPLYYKNYSDYETAVATAEDRWNDAISEVTFSPGTGLQAKVWIHDVYDEWTVNAAWTVPTDTTDGWFDIVDVMCNTYLMDTVGPSWKNKILTHEFGHVLGLNDENDEYCVMRQGTSYPGTPQEDDIYGIEYIYQ